jgi:DNA-binding response OmpR family regulator
MDNLDVLVADRDPRSRRSAARAIGLDPRFRVRSCCGTSTEIRRALTARSFDVVVVDRLQVLAVPPFPDILARGARPEIVISSPTRHDAMAAFDQGVCDFVVQPASADRLRLAVYKAVDKSRLRRGLLSLPLPERLSVQTRNQVDFVNLTDVQAIYTSGERVWIRVRTGSLPSRGTLTFLASVLPAPPFVRVHRRYLINLDHAVLLGKQGRGRVVTLACGQTVPVAEAHEPHLRSVLAARSRNREGDRSLHGRSELVADGDQGGPAWPCRPLRETRAPVTDVTDNPLDR